MTFIQIQLFYTAFLSFSESEDDKFMFTLINEFTHSPQIVAYNSMSFYVINDCSNETSQQIKRN